MLPRNLRQRPPFSTRCQCDLVSSFEPEVDERGRPRMLTRAQLDELGGVEYRALGLLIWILVMYQL